MIVVRIFLKVIHGSSWNPHWSDKFLDIHNDFWVVVKIIAFIVYIILTIDYHHSAKKPLRAVRY